MSRTLRPPSTPMTDPTSSHVRSMRRPSTQRTSRYGGAAVALLTFVGSLPAEQRRAVAATLDWFAWGVAAAVAGLACAYFTNHGLAVQERTKTFTDKPPYVINGANTKRWSYFVLVFRLLAIIVGSGSVVLFLVGMLSVRAALIKLA
jgi:hypothetical protein